MSQPVYAPFIPIYENNNRWIISSASQQHVFEEMKQFTYPRTIDEQRLQPYVVYNPETRQVWYHCQPVFNGNNQATTEWEFVLKLIQQTLGLQEWTQKPLIRAQCMMTHDEIQAYLQQYPQAS